MKNVDLRTLTTEELISRFAEIAIGQDQALLYDRIARYKKLYSQMDAVDNELRARGIQARRALISLYDHPNPQVRLKAAIRSLGVAPVEARTVLYAIQRAMEQPYALDAGMIIRGLEDGSFVPT